MRAIRAVFPDLPVLTLELPRFEPAPAGAVRRYHQATFPWTSSHMLSARHDEWSCEVPSPLLNILSRRFPLLGLGDISHQRIQCFGKIGDTKIWASDDRLWEPRGLVGEHKWGYGLIASAARRSVRLAVEHCMSMMGRHSRHHWCIRGVGLQQSRVANASKNVVTMKTHVVCLGSPPKQREGLMLGFRHCDSI